MSFSQFLKITSYMRVCLKFAFAVLNDPYKALLHFKNIWLLHPVYIDQKHGTTSGGRAVFTLVHCRYKRSRYTNRKYLAEKHTPLLEGVILDPCSYTCIPVYNTKKLLDNTCINNEVNLKS